MCLDVIRNFKPCEIGYKAVYKIDGEFYPPLGSIKPLPLGIWLKEKDYRLSVYGNLQFIGGGEVQYPFGWHIFHTKKAAKGWYPGGFLVLRVRVRGAHTVGLQDGQKITVAKEIKILEEVR